MVPRINQDTLSLIKQHAQTGKKNAKFTMKLRVPYWATEGFDVLLNGKRIAKSYQPCSYVEIPARKWKDRDVVEVVMPFTKHLDFGPDKMEHAPAYEKNGKTEYTPMWAGAFMYGPLVMATTDVSSWDEATVDVTGDLSEVTLNGASSTDKGPDAHLYTMTFKGKTFIPDYQADRHVTHYFRMNVPTDPTAPAVTVASEGIDKSALRELVLVAKSRCDEQQAWNALTVKVPEYAPWAPHAFARMESQLTSSQQMLDASDDKYSQEEIDKAASALNGIINSMRPGNLPELEDMDELMTLLEQARKLPEGNEQLEEAIRYAGMVIRYVSDGSGTMDMIQRATKQLKSIVE